ncbi:unnamed protein product, partial [Polarella glacialis]
AWKLWLRTLYKSRHEKALKHTDAVQQRMQLICELKSELQLLQVCFILWNLAPAMHLHMAGDAALIDQTRPRKTAEGAQETDVEDEEEDLQQEVEVHWKLAAAETAKAAEAALATAQEAAEALAMARAEERQEAVLLGACFLDKLARRKLEKPALRRWRCSALRLEATAVRQRLQQGDRSRDLQELEEQKRSLAEEVWRTHAVACRAILRRFKDWRLSLCSDAFQVWAWSARLASSQRARDVCYEEHDVERVREEANDLWERSNNSMALEARMGPQQQERLITDVFRAWAGAFVEHK